MHDTSKPVEEENITVQILESIETEDAMGQTLDALIRSGKHRPLIALSRCLRDDNA